MAERGDDSDDALIFHNPGTPYRPLDARGVLRKFKIAADQIGRPDAKLHSLRHTAGSYLSANGASAPYVQAFLGHANMRTTENYLHVMAEETNRIAARLRRNLATAA
jgi:integrase